MELLVIAPAPATINVSPDTVALAALGDTVRLSAAVLDQLGRVIGDAAVVERRRIRRDRGLRRAGCCRGRGYDRRYGHVGGGLRGCGGVGDAGGEHGVRAADTLVAGDTLRLSAEALDANGRAVSGAAFSWSSSDPAVATVDTTGLVTAVSAGGAAIAATSSRASGHMELLVIAPAPATINVSPDTVALAALGDTVRLSAAVLDQLGRVIGDAAVSWSSADESVATVDSAGLVVAAGEGTTGVTATSGEASGVAAVSVMQAVSTVSVFPAADTLVAGDTLRLSAEALDANGRAVSGAAFSWSSSEPAVATVDGVGLVTAASPGEAAITATSGGASGHMELLVIALAATAIDVTPPMVALEALGDTVRLAAEVYDQLGRVIEDAVVSWSSDDESVVTADPNGLVTAVGEGTATIAAASGAASGSVPVSVMRIAASVVVSPATGAVASGATLRLTAAAFDWNGHVVEGAEFSWSSSDPSVATVGAAGLVHGAGPGIATITARSGRAKGTSQIAVGNPDRAALVAFYHATDGRYWSRSDNWLTEAPVAEWYGIRVDDQGRVSHLQLPDNNIAGRMPWQLGHLATVRELDLSRNGLTGPISPQLGNLQRLEVLRLRGNRLTGSIPSELGNLANLRRMDLNNNRLSGPIPSDLGKLDRLESLGLISNQLTGSIPPELGNLARLWNLNLAYNQLTGPIPSELGDLVNVGHVHLELNELTGSIPPELGNLPELERMNLAGNELTGSIPPELGDLPELERLSLGGNQLTGSIPRELGDLTNLSQLELNGNRLTGSIPPELGDLTNLSRLYLLDNRLTGPIPPELGNLVKLHRFWLNANRLTGPLPRSFLALTELERLVFEGNDGVCAPGTSAFVAWLGHIDLVAGPLCNEADEVALIELFEATGGDSWTRSDGWPGDGALTEWYGVATDSLGHVLTLDLTRNELVGRLPSALAQLTRLHALRIGGNALVGQLQVGLAQLPLQEFSYSDTRLCVPRDSSFQAWLNSLPAHEGTGETCGDLSDRDILVALHEAAGGPRWKKSDNWLTDAPLDQWYGVSVDAEGRVSGLGFFQNNLTGTIPPELVGLANLRELDLRGNELTGPIPP